MKWERPIENPEDPIRSFSPTGLEEDYFNAWQWLMLARDIIEHPRGYVDEAGLEQAKKQLLDWLQKSTIPTYEEYGLAKWGSRAIQRIEASNPDTIREINTLAIEFNAAKEKLIQEKDINGIRKFFHRAHKLIYGEK